MATTLIFSVKYLMLSVAVLSAAFLLKLLLPSIMSFLVYEMPLIYGSLLTWLTPPYLYVVINGIIITIAASSRFQHQKGDEVTEAAPATKTASGIRSVYEVPAVYKEAVLNGPAEIGPDFEAIGPSCFGQLEAKVLALNREEDEEEFVISRSDYSLYRGDSTEIPTEYSLSRGDSTEIASLAKEKPLVSARFSHRRGVKASPEGNRLLGVSKPKRNETLESTWKTITEGRPIPLNRHLKKSETFSETNGRPKPDESMAAVTPVKKSETFKERRATPSPSPSPGSGKLRKEASPSQDELNRRVEAFIKKFNEEIRLQRQESFKHYREMVNRGSHY